MLEVEGLTAGYRNAVVHSASIRVPDGGAVCLLGPNGAGKSTLMGAISGVTPNRQGKVSFNGKELIDKPPWDIVREGVSHVPQGRHIFGPLTVFENLKMGSYTRPQDAETRLAPVLRTFPELETKGKELGSSLSGGQQQMLAIARGLMSGPSLLMLDEPSLGLSPRYVQDLRDLLHFVRETTGAALFLIEQDVRLALDISDYVYVLAGGRVVMESRVSETSTDDIADAFMTGLSPDTAS